MTVRVGIARRRRGPITRVQSQATLPDARKIILFNGYVEGWALYAEQLAQEMGFFAGHPRLGAGLYP